MRDYVSIGSAPCDEDCVQVSRTEDYIAPMKAECRRFLELIRKKLGPEPEGASLAIKSNPHDFGTYYDVVCYYDDEEARRYAYRCESESPRTWADDKPAQKEDRWLPLGLGEDPGQTGRGKAAPDTTRGHNTTGTAVE